MAIIVPTFTSRAKLNLTSMLPRDYDPRLQPSGQDGNALQIGVQMNVFGVLEVKLFNRIYISIHVQIDLNEEDIIVELGLKFTWIDER